METMHHIEEQIVDYLSGKLSAKDKASLEAWISASDEHAHYFSQIREVWFSALTPAEAAMYDADAAYQRFLSRIHRDANAGNRMRTRRVIRLACRYAAVVALVSVVSVLMYRWGVHSEASRQESLQIEVPDGARSKVHLPDGSLVWLNAGSRMTYTHPAGSARREVHLSGEGYFEVKHDERQPFVVITRNVEVEVLGTKFNFSDYPDHDEAIVTLLDGKIQLDNLAKPDPKVTLTPNQRALLNKDSHSLTIEPYEAANASQWTAGYLCFDEELLTDIAKRLERNFGVTVTIATDSLRHYRFYGNFMRSTQHLVDVLDALASTQKIRYTLHGREVTIY